MTTTSGAGSALAPYRVLDLTTELGALGPQVLGGLGADVLKIEPPGGDPARQDWPRLAVRGEEHSLRWLWANAGKRSVTLDLEREAGRAELKRLVADADFLFESRPVGYLDKLGLSYEELARINPRLVMVRISPFGQSGPYKDWQGSDIVSWALGGQMLIDGDPDRPPVRVSVPQTWALTGLHAAAGAMTAHYERQRSGLGQMVDISAQECVVWTLMIAVQVWDISHINTRREGAFRRAHRPDGTSLLTRAVWPCKDGFVTWMLASGANAGARASLMALVNWMVEEGMAGGADKVDWASITPQDMTQDLYDELIKPFAAFFRSKTMAELYDAAGNRVFQLAPITDARAISESPQLAARDFFQDVPYPELGTSLRFSGVPVRLSGTPYQPLRPAPLRPEQPPANGTSAVEVSRSSTSQSVRRTANSALPFEGLKVLDFSWVGVGPIVARHLADFGATVIRVETSARPDTLRLAGPFRDGIAGLDRSAFGAVFNTNKLGLALNLGRPRGREIALRLAAWADVATDSMTPGSLAKLKLAYEDLREVNPKLVMYSTCQQGQTGPYRKFAGYGQHGAAISGLHGVTGWPDREPAGIYGAYTDFVAPWLCFTSLVAALDHRDRTGEGQYLDQSQIEAGLQVLSPWMADYFATGKVVARAGNDDPDMYPHGAYECTGEDRWVALACRNNTDWQALCRVLGRDDWADAERFVTQEGRRDERDIIDAAITGWTSTRSSQEAMEVLQAAGVPAGAAHTCEDLLTDAQLAHRGAFWALDHAVMGRHTYNAPAWKLSATPAQGRRAAPALGQHTFEILTDILGMPADEIGELVAEGVLE